MTDMATMKKLPDVKSAVLGDLAGGYLDAFNELDGETVAAVTGFVASALTQAGAELGLGALRRITLSGVARACVVVVQADSLITASVEPARALAAVEKAIDAAVQGRV